MRKAGIAALLSLGLCLRMLAIESPSLPELPKLTVTDLLPEVRGQVQQAYDLARQHPDSAEASGKLGMLFDLYDRPEQAAVCYERAHQLAPRSFKWLYYLGSLQAKQGEHAQAARTLRAALGLQPAYLPALLKLGESLFSAGDLDGSERVYSATTRQFPYAAEAYYGLGRIEVARGAMAAAIESFRKACDLFPPYGAAHYELAQADRKLGKTKEAQQHLALHEKDRTLVPPVDDPLRDELRALDIEAPSLLERGVKLEQAGRIEDAIAAHEKALELDPKLAQAHVNLIILYGRTGDFEKAEEHYRAAINLNPNQLPDAYYNYAVLLVKEGKLDQAEQTFRKALEINPSYADAHNDLGYLLERQGNLLGAAAEYQKAIEDKPDFRQAHFNLGRILVSQQQYPEAIKQLQQTLTPIDDSTPTYLYALGAAYGRAGDRQNALRYLQDAKEQASARAQAQLLSDIEKDLQSLSTSAAPH
ncbi:MAG TPA: tetratricopeptide repeat protein [Terriglobia bacterium]